MIKRAHLRKKIIFYKKKNKIILIFILLIVAIVLGFKYVDKKLIPVYQEYASLEAKKIGSIIINRAVNEDINQDLNYDDLLIVNKNDKNEVIMVDFNPVTVNKLLKNINLNIQKDFDLIKSGKVNELKWLGKETKSLKKGIVCQMPSGIIFNNVLFKNLGPKIPVRIDLEGDILTNINTKVSNYGINNALIEISVLVEINEKVILPVITKNITVKSSIPLFVKLIQGSVPNYLGTIDRNSSYY